MINGIFSLLFVIISLIIGLAISLRYRVFKEKRLLQVGLGWIGISEPWWPSSIGFLLSLNYDIEITAQLYIIIGYVFLPLFLIAWLTAILFLLNLKKRNKILSIYIIFAAIFEIIIIYFLITDVSMLGVMISPVDIDWETIMVIYALLNLLFFIIPGLFFAHESLKSDTKETKLKGKFLLVAFISFLIGALLETLITLPPNRMILVFSGILYYIGFMMPTGIKNRLLKT